MRICNLELSSLQKFRWRRWGSFFLDLCRLDPPLATIQGGIFPGNLGTGFPGYPWTSGEIFGMSHAYLMIYTSKRNDILL